MGEAEGGGWQVSGWPMLHAREGECPVPRQGKRLAQGPGGTGWGGRGTGPAPARFLVTGCLWGVPTESRQEEKAVLLFLVKWEEYEIYDE